MAAVAATVSPSTNDSLTLSRTSTPASYISQLSAPASNAAALHEDNESTSEIFDKIARVSQMISSASADVVSSLEESRGMLQEKIISRISEDFEKLTTCYHTAPLFAGWAQKAIEAWDKIKADSTINFMGKLSAAANLKPAKEGMVDEGSFLVYCRVDLAYHLIPLAKDHNAQINAIRVWSCRPFPSNHDACNEPLLAEVIKLIEKVFKEKINVNGSKTVPALITMVPPLIGRKLVELGANVNGKDLLGRSAVYTLSRHFHDGSYVFDNKATELIKEFRPLIWLPQDEKLKYLKFLVEKRATVELDDVEAFAAGEKYVASYDKGPFPLEGEKRVWPGFVRLRTQFKLTLDTHLNTVESAIRDMPPLGLNFCVYQVMRITSRFFYGNPKEPKPRDVNGYVINYQSSE